MNEDRLEEQRQTPALPMRNTPSSGRDHTSKGDSGDMKLKALNNIAHNASGRSISPRMREEDADLLESMHYASSQVSQYTPDGTPLLRPKDRSLPMQDVAFISMPLASTSEILTKKQDGNEKYRNISMSLSFRGNDNDNSISDGGASVGNGWSLNYSGPVHTDSGANEPQSMPSTPGKHHDSCVRKLLSGEIRTFSVEMDENDVSEPGDDGLDRNQYAIPETTVQQEVNHEQMEEGERTQPPDSIAHDVSFNKTEQDGMAKRRRVSDAILFAQSVRERISINPDDLCIIDDSEIDDDDDDDDSDDDDEVNEEDIESKEKAALNHSIHENVLSSEYLIGLSPVAPKKAKPTIDHETPIRKSSNIESLNFGHRRKGRNHTWPFQQPLDIEFSSMNHLSDGIGDRTNFVYKGICANPPEITKRGIQRGNYAQLHRKAWLEVSDKYHRYGKNLRLYYRYWERLGFPTNQFFDWLDSKGEAAGQPLPNLEECPRSVLDADTVLYITNLDITDGYELGITPGEDGRGLVVNVHGDPVQTGPDGWIFILRDNSTYGAPKITSVSGQSKQRFHHSSFFGGKAVASAGIFITDSQGYLTRLYPHSGHYRPGEAHMQRMLFVLYRKGIDLRTLDVDTQQLSHVSREKDTGKVKTESGGEVKEKKVKKVDSLHLEKAADVACFLAHKADFIGKGIFDKIHQIRKADVTSVSEALHLVNNGKHARTANSCNI
uniref:Uncharacterized protein n=1 Tax=Pseudo-nitzschia australis TaxID=44445 RepID=A0A7S4AME0_9STRA|mmetsp:Transcript_8122/g.17509  ORF Transcript_8122/g.17509 Transcript_8122/m.17509 type:complete len:720 (+) Transcript_8122:182-2341(+)|eukprot:CAMPEP_0168172156 /NCGR_PEP_ID=MMETSP0139_2-20121125/5088_1 /TAXON_ID=44445 /ORGANISM="Pseudo-nitzschia australis, Strain 10249 10 AB" /LENGTH=719 /DNA_ID=CAMNT_0008089757 /DNA_START=128 /DNA_END=2287 /DNA_ORIENTATION=+